MFEMGPLRTFCNFQIGKIKPESNIQNYFMSSGIDFAKTCNT